MRKKNRKVFHLISHFDLGGAERIAANIAESHSEGYEYHIVEILRGRSAFTGSFLSELRGAGVHCHRSLMPDFRFHFMAERIAALLFPLRFLLLWLRFRPDVVHSHTETPDMCLWAFFRVFPWLQRRCRIVRTIHNTCLWTGLKRFGSRVECFYQRNGANVAISRSVMESYAAEYGETVPVVCNGVQAVAQERYPHLAENRTNVVFAGRFDEQKGISHLIYIIEALQPMGQYHFHVFGSGKLQPLVCERLAHLPGVSVRPPLFGISRYLASFDYMLMPSEFEGLGLMSVEASLAGLPVVCSDCRGLDETVPPGWPLVAHGNSHEDYMRIFRTLIPHADRGALAAEARAFVSERFTVERMQAGYERFYELKMQH